MFRWKRRSRGAPAARGLVAGTTRFLLRRAAARRGDAALTSPMDGVVFRGRLRGLVGEDVLVDAWRQAGAGRIVPGQQLVLTFHDHAGTCVGLCRVRHHAPGRGDGDRDRFAVSAPADLLVERGRNAYRVPAGEVVGLRASLEAREGRLLPVGVVDLSWTGALVRVREGSGPRPAVDDETSLALSFEGRSVVLDAVVRRISGDALALCFHRVAEPDRAPEELRRLVRALEGRWLSARGGSGAADGSRAPR